MKTIQEILADFNKSDYMIWFLSNGQSFTNVNKKLSKEYSIKMDAKLKQCYYNSLRLFMIRSDYRYFEGYMISKRIPIPLDHCFLIDSENRVIDITMGIKSKYTQFADQYYGVEIPRKIVLKYLFKLSRSGDYIHNYYQDYIKQ